MKGEIIKCRVIRFTVEGSGQFPVDMLRYDRCYPSSQSDVAAMVASGRRKVTLTTYVPTHLRGDAYPTEGRWSSFSWVVIHREVL